MPSPKNTSATGLLGKVDLVRQDVGRNLDSAQRSALGQFFTPAPTARLMASMVGSDREKVRLLDPGAGVGILTAAWVTALCAGPHRPGEVVLTAYELDDSLIPALTATLEDCRRACIAAGIACQVDIRHRDFIEDAVANLDGGVLARDGLTFDVAILNPPYKKFRADSPARLLLRRLGIETSNLYTAFLSLAVRLLADRGELVAITPRSFCNGPYFRPFRVELLRSVSLTRIHLFESRNDAFREDAVLQENVVLHAQKGLQQAGTVVISQSHDPEDDIVMSREVPFDSVVYDGDPEFFIHLVPDEEGHALAGNMRALPCTLDQLGVSVSTGRVVDFRAREWLRHDAVPGSVPLIYPTHFQNGFVRWPKPGSKKPNAVLLNPESEGLMVGSGVYTLVKRFSSKEERRRVVAAVFDPRTVPGALVGFENHLNYFHEDGRGLARDLAIGLCAFLNSTQVDAYFRQFNGHTQVNATDLRTLRYPTRRALEDAGKQLADGFPDQRQLDALVGDLLILEAA